MSSLSKDLKQMLTGLAYQDAGDFLSRSEKMKVLGNGLVSRGKPNTPAHWVEARPVTKRIAFISDGASVMVGVKSRLKQQFPNLFTWLCLNHRLELAVTDALKDVTATYHFQSFMDSLYCIYSQSPKNQNEILKISAQFSLKEYILFAFNLYLRKISITLIIFVWCVSRIKFRL